MDFMNLNQSAHGDREFAFMETRMGLVRKTVVGHWTRAGRARRGSASGRRAAAGWREAHRSRSRGSGTTCARSRSPRATRSRRSSGSASPCTGYGVGDLVEAVNAVSDGEVDRLVAEYEDGLRPRSRASRRRRAARVAARRGADRGRAARDPRRGAVSGRSPTPSRTSHGLKQLPGIAVAAADGRRLRVRRRGRLEDGRARPHREGDEHRPGRRHLVHGGLHVRPRAVRRRRCSARTCSRSARRSPRDGRRARSTRSRSAAGTIRCGSSSRRRPARRSSPRCSTSATASGSSLNEVELVEPEEALPRLPVARALWKPKPDFATAAEAWLRAGGPHHSVLCRAIGSEAFADLAEIAGIELLVIDEHDPDPRRRQRAPLEPGVLPARRRPASAARRAARARPRGEHGARPRRARRPHLRERERRRPRRGRDRDQAERRLLRPAHARRDRRRRPRERRSGGRPDAALVGHAHPPRPLPRLARRRGRRSHALVVRHRLGAGRRGDPLLRDDACRPLRRRRPRHAPAHRRGDRRRVRAGDGGGDRGDVRPPRARAARPAGRPRRLSRAVRVGCTRWSRRSRTRSRSRRWRPGRCAPDRCEADVPPIGDDLRRRHFRRKHGPAAYYGQTR